jgi:hypothetical protein
VVFERHGKCEGYSAGRTIVIDPDIYPPRRNWLFCHELAHIILGHTESDIFHSEMETEADELASELMLPRDEFRNNMKRMDLIRLKEKYSHASWEVIAHRWADERPAVLTIFDNNLLTNRYAPKGLSCPSQPTQPEIEMIQECSNIKENIIRTIANGITLHLQVFFIDDGRGVERVLLLTEPQTEDF